MVTIIGLEFMFGSQGNQIVGKVKLRLSRVGCILVW